MQKIEQIDISFKQLREGNYILPDDRHGIASYLLTNARIKSQLTDPFIEDEDQTAISLMIVDGIIEGRNTSYPIKVILDGKEFYACSGSGLMVTKECRHLALGMELFMQFAKHKKYKFSIGASISDMALPLYRKLHFHILEYPQLILLRNAHSILATKHLGWLSGLVNVPIKLFSKYEIYKANKIAKNYDIYRETIIPKWVDKFTLNDGHKYCEYHDQKWMQWTIDNQLHEDKRNETQFYGIYKNGNPVGFYITKERFRDEAGGVLKNFMLGVVLEWGSYDESKLSETDILSLTLLTFSKSIEIIQTATSNVDTIRAAKKLGFIRHGYGHIGFKDNTKTYNDASDINLWRIRFGCTDINLI